MDKQEIIFPIAILGCLIGLIFMRAITNVFIFGLGAIALAFFWYMHRKELKEVK